MAKPKPTAANKQTTKARQSPSDETKRTPEARYQFKGGTLTSYSKHKAKDCFVRKKRCQDGASLYPELLSCPRRDLDPNYVPDVCG